VFSGIYTKHMQDLDTDHSDEERFFYEWQRHQFNEREIAGTTASAGTGEDTEIASTT